MDQHVHPSGEQQLWQRVAPSMEAYPSGPVGALWQASNTPAPLQGLAPRREEGTLPPYRPPEGPQTALPPYRPPLIPGGGPGPGLPPGAIQDPCCMGSEAKEMLEVLRGFMEEELMDRRSLLALSRQAPPWARQSLREMGEEAGSNARDLGAAIFLITGQQPPIPQICGQVLLAPWKQALREAYHAKACNALNYARAADGTTDPCLTRLLQRLSRQAYAETEQLMEILQRSL